MLGLHQALRAARKIEAGTAQHFAARDICIARGVNPDSYVASVGSEPPITNWQRIVAEHMLVAAFHDIAGAFGPVLELILEGQQASAHEIARLRRSIEAMTQAMSDQLNRLSSELDSLGGVANEISAELAAHIQTLPDDSADTATLKGLNDRLDTIVSGLSTAAASASSAATQAAAPPATAAQPESEPPTNDAAAQPGTTSGDTAAQGTGPAS